MPSTRKSQLLARNRRARVRAKLFGTPERPRLNIFRSNQHTSLQVIDDSVGHTVAAVTSLRKKMTGTKTEIAIALVSELLSQLEAKKVKALVLDRGSYRYHGRIRAIAEALRAGKIEV